MLRTGIIVITAASAIWAVQIIKKQNWRNNLREGDLVKTKDGIFSIWACYGDTLVLRVGGVPRRIPKDKVHPPLLGGYQHQIGYWNYNPRS